MGVGKSPIAGAAIAVMWAEGMIKPGQIAAIMCPPHLIKKWQAELRDVIPGCVAHIADKDLAKGETLVDDVTAFMKRAAEDTDRLHILIVSRSRAKLGEGWQAAYQVRHQRFAQWPKGGPAPKHFLTDEGELREGVTRIVEKTVPICPTCSADINSSKDGKGTTDPVRWMEQKPRICHQCGGALWQLKRTFSAPDEGDKFPKRNPRYPVATLLRQRYRDRLAVTVCDEIHECKSIASDQGRAMQNLVLAADYAIGLTGTIFGGMASSVFWLEWAFNRSMPHQYPIADGVETAINRWVRTMGVMVKVIEYRQDKKAGVTNGTDRHEHRPKEAPGISPLLIKQLLSHCIWVGLEDLAFDLPEYREIPVPVSLPRDVQQHYDAEKARLLDYLMGCRNEGDASFLGAYLQACLRYPSTCYQSKPVIHRTPYKDENGQQITRLVTTLKGFGEGRIYPKEEALLDLLSDELAAGRPCAVFVAQSGKLRIQDRLADLIRRKVEGANPFILESNTVATDKRDGWVRKQVEKSGNVLICNPKLVSTGLDLLWCKSLIFFEISYSLYDVAQASRRHWRIGQTDECRVFHLYHTDTMEAQAIKLVSEKQAAAALLGGDADGGGLAQISGGAASLEAELARSISADEGVVDASSLFQQSAKQSADFVSGWAAQGEVDEDAEVIEVVALENCIGKRFYRDKQAHEVTDYGPLTEATYRVTNLVTQEVISLPAADVLAAKPIARDLPLSIERKPKPKTKAAKQPVRLPQVPLLAGHHAGKVRHPNAVVLTERGKFFVAYGEDAEKVAACLNAVLDERLVGGVRVKQTVVAAKDLDHYVTRLTKAGMSVAVARERQTVTGDAPQPEARPALPPKRSTKHLQQMQQGQLALF
jgi:hypothetical protein